MRVGDLWSSWPLLLGRYHLSINVPKKDPSTPPLCRLETREMSNLVVLELKVLVTTSQEGSSFVHPPVKTCFHQWLGVAGAKNQLGATRKPHGA